MVIVRMLTNINLKTQIKTNLISRNSYAEAMPYNVSIYRILRE